MTDETEKKARRRGPPRKRTPRKKAAPESAVPDTAPAALEPAGAEAPPADAVPEAATPAQAEGVDSADSATPDTPVTAAPSGDEQPVGDAPAGQEPASPAEDAPQLPVPAPVRLPVTATAPQALRPGELIRVPLSVRWRDLDAFNHVNNSKYLSYLEEARLRWMLSIPGMGLEDDTAPVVAASNLNYRRPIGWPGEVVVELFVERVGATSVTIGHRIVDTARGDVYCDGNVVMVWIDRRRGHAAPLPAAVRAACGAR